MREGIDDLVHGRVGPRREPDEAQNDGEDVHEKPPVEPPEVSLLLPHGDVAERGEDESQPCAAHSPHQRDEETQPGDHLREHECD